MELTTTRRFGFLATQCYRLGGVIAALSATFVSIPNRALIITRDCRSQSNFLSVLILCYRLCIVTELNKRGSSGLNLEDSSSRHIACRGRNRAPLSSASSLSCSLFTSIPPSLPVPAFALLSLARSCRTSHCVGSLISRAACHPRAPLHAIE
ncbi:hypothetical protein BJV78DRAFT_1230324 [Lactifluus subvellereus]|nr:hypothetical protein BJV78DRAFT_1230324 [Lactifluus subvellereus]